MLLSSVLAVLLLATCSHAEIHSKCVSPRCVKAAAEVWSTANFSADPCENFYEYACGYFADSHKMPSGQKLWDYFKILQDQIDNDSKYILNSTIAADDPQAVQKAKTMYAACMDTDALDKRGLEPVKNLLESLGGWPVFDPNWTGEGPNWNKIGDIVRDYAISFVLSFSSLANLENANTTAIYLSAPTLGLPQPIIPQVKEPDFFEDMRMFKTSAEDLPFTKYIVKVATVLREYLNVNISDETIKKEMVDTVYFMQDLSKAASRKDLNKEDTMTQTIEDFQQYTNQNMNTSIIWLDFLQHAGFNVTSASPVLVGDDVMNVLKVFEESDPRVIWNHIISRLIVFLAPESNKELREAAFDFNVEMKYIDKDYPRSTYCLHKTMDYPYIGFSHAVAYQIKKTFDPRKLKTAEGMMDDLMAAFHELVNENDWMDEETKQKASEKAEAMFVLSGFPTWTETAAELDEFYSKMNVSQDDHFGNVARLKPFLQAKSFATLGKPRDRNDWTQSPLTVNAFYNSLNNRITFPMAIMAEPFFSGDKLERAFDYGRIGAILGHEITHGFDSEGRSYDGFGTISDWWSNETEAKYLERQQCFVDQYNSYIIQEINATVDGTLSLRENIADNGGIREAYRAFQTLKTRDEMPPPRLPGLERFSPEKLFFLGYATMWCRTETEAGLMAMQSDSHSPNRFRVIGSLSNMEEFSNVFNCPVGSKMNPEEKCILW